LEVGVKVGYSAPQIQEIIDKLAFTIIPLAPEMDFSVLPYEVRDEMDLPILAAALKIDSDIILTGDKDLLALGLKRPQLMNPADFLRNFSEEKATSASKWLILLFQTPTFSDGRIGTSQYRQGL